ncbi:C6 zinc finger protein [Colletotrichum costaricense]|uniref:C6 zinc finger protein n=1 Tax=Colletotrichum costaricense TaxID=1209916 RepID=A0AAI9YN01_9PEZI|nr:C6 zinc finger protein [Colletotrichum costaricense]KAK1517062.1 C6 zinc finger protein [Colletotrichum costaricense]
MSNSHAETRVSSRKRPAYPRKRAVQACLTCRQRRTKCDNEKPACNSCKKLGIDCVYHEFEKASQDTGNVADKVAMTLEFERQAHSWARSLPPSLRPAIDDSSDVTFDFDENGQLRFILSGHLIDCLELMYWPYIYAAVHGRLGDDRDSHMLASRGLDFCVRRININKTGFFHRHHGTWLMLQSCTRSALVLIAAAYGGLHDKLPHDWKASVEDVVNLLKHWVDEVPDFRRMIEILASHE